MTDRENVIRGLECCAAVNCGADCPYSPVGGCRVKVLEDAISLLREQESVKPKKEDGWPTMITVCGACGAQIPTPGGWRYNYCPTCGRGIKWDA